MANIMLDKDKLWELALKLSKDNPKGVLEIFQRGKNGRCKDIVQYVLDKSGESTKEKITNGVNELIKGQKALSKGISEVTNLQKETMNMLNNMQLLNKAGVLLSSTNLVATVAGFAIMNAKLQDIQISIDSLWDDVKKISDIDKDSIFESVVSEYSDMLDHRQTNRPYTQDRYRQLVSSEYNIINVFIKTLNSDLAYDPYTMLQSLFSMVLFFSATIILYDRVYYFENKGKASNGKIWHNDHDKWVKIFDHLESEELRKKVQDYAFIDKNLDSHTTDIFVSEFMNQIHSAKQGILDNQQLLLLCDKEEEIKQIDKTIDEEALEAIKQVIPSSEFDLEAAKEELLAVA